VNLNINPTVDPDLDRPRSTGRSNGAPRSSSSRLISALPTGHDERVMKLVSETSYTGSTDWSRRRQGPRWRWCSRSRRGRRGRRGRQGRQGAH